MMHDWRHYALCRGMDPELWFPIGTEGPALLQIARARAVCADCPVASSCLAWALEHSVEGIWAGTTEDERRLTRQLVA